MSAMKHAMLRRRDERMVRAAARQILAALQGARVPLSTEGAAQAAIEACLVEAGIPCEREYRLSNQSRIDFFAPSLHGPGVGIEVKTQGQRAAIRRQIERYLKHDIVGAIIVLTARSISLPCLVQGKSVYVLSLGEAWL